jgi:predicted acetyltransferase
MSEVSSHEGAITAEPAPAAARRTVANLMELYLYEFSDIDGRPIGEDGCYGYATLDAYWHEAGRYPLLIRVDGRLAGFALVMEHRLLDGESPGHLIAEFFVMRAQRRRGIGTAVATQLFDRFPGPWWVSEHGGNAQALAFWRTVIGRYTGGSYREETWVEPDGTPCVAQRFTTPGTADTESYGAHSADPAPR